MQKQTLPGDLVKLSAKNMAQVFALVAIGMTLAGAGIYIGDTDDAPGAALLGLLLMIGSIVFAVRIARRRA